MDYQYFKRPDGTIIGRVVSDGTPSATPAGWKEVTEAEWRAVDTHYFRMPSGFVMDQSEQIGGQPRKYLDHGGTEIGRAEFEIELAVQIKRQAAEREAWIQERIDEGRGFEDFEKVAAMLEKAPRELVKDA